MRAMAEYIEREAALSAQNKSMNLNEMRERLKRIPAADVVPAVRCKDCRFAHFGPNWITCENFNGLCTTALGLEDFCSYGERRHQDGKL